MPGTPCRHQGKGSSIGQFGSSNAVSSWTTQEATFCMASTCAFRSNSTLGTPEGINSRRIEIPSLRASWKSRGKINSRCRSLAAIRKKFFSFPRMLGMFQEQQLLVFRLFGSTDLHKLPNVFPELPLWKLILLMLFWNNSVHEILIRIYWFLKILLSKI